MINKKLYDALTDMGCYNDFYIKPIYQLPRSLTNYGFDYDVLNEQIKKLDKDELLSFVEGEESDIEYLVNKYQLNELNDFMNEVFDGKLTHLFVID